MKDTYIDSMRRFEGFCAAAKPDGSQLSNGYGTRALFAGETISREDAELRFRSAVSSAEKLVEQCTPGLDEGAKAALTSLTYNTGVHWMQSGLGEAVRRHDYATVRDLFQRYTKANGHDLPGLVSRRSEEVSWFGTDDSTPTVKAAVPLLEAAPPKATDAGNWAVPISDSDVLLSPVATFAAPLVKSIELWWSLLQSAVHPGVDSGSLESGVDGSHEIQ